MQLRDWICQLNTAVTERDLVVVVSAFFRQVRGTTAVPDECLPAEPGNAAEIRDAASWLSRLHLTSCVEERTREAFTQLATLFHLAAERVAVLEARGLLVPFGRAGGRRAGYARP